VILFPVKFFVIFLEQRISSFELWILAVRFLFLLHCSLLHSFASLSKLLLLLVLSLLCLGR